MSDIGGDSREGSCDKDQSDIENKLPNTNCLIKGYQFSFAVGRRIERGKMGAVYEVLRQSDGKYFAAKLEVCEDHFHGINMDYMILNRATQANCKHIPKLIDRGKIEGHFKFVVMEMLGNCVQRLRKSFVQYHFSLSTSLRLAIQALNAIKELHMLGFIHRDIKASNFVIRSLNEPAVCLVDFGLCRSYKNSNDDIKPPREKAQFRGTTRYASINAHKEMELSRRDDLESWFYMVIEITSGCLPWSDLHKDNRDEVKKLKEESRSTLHHELLCRCPKTEFRRILQYIDGLGYYSEPDYGFIEQLLQLAMKNNGIKMDEPYDWQE